MIMNRSAQIAVVTRRFPKLSETFVLFEMLALEQSGLRLSIYHLQSAESEPAHPDAARLKASNELVARANAWQMLGCLLQSPRRSLHALWLAVCDHGWNWQHNWRRALGLAIQLRHAGATAIYAHFMDDPTSVARMAALLTGLPFAASAHAKDIYLTEPAVLARRLRAAAFVTTCSDYNARHLRELAPDARIVRCYHGIDPQRFSATPAFRPPSGRPLILSVGRLRAKKGFDTLIAACAELSRRDVAFRCEIVGYGPEHEALLAQIRRAGLERNVSLLGRQTHREVLAKLPDAQAFALPCRIEGNGDRDGVPNALLEAMAAGTPVISTRVSGIPEAIRHGETGLLVDPDSPEHLADGLQSLLQDPALAVRLARNGHAFVTSHFARLAHIKRLAHLLRQLGENDHGEVAYVLKGFPRLSESFITNEIIQLESEGLALRLFTLKAGEAAATPMLDSIHAILQRLPQTTSLSATALYRWLANNVGPFLRSSLRVAVRRPWRFSRTVTAAMVMTLRYRQVDAEGRRGPARKVFIKELLQAIWIADSLLRHPGVRHLHGHFCHGATTVTWFVSQLTGIAFSFTAHAKDIYQTSLNPGDLLQRKLRAARFAVTCTGANRAHLRTTLGDPACSALHTVYHGLDVSRFAPGHLPRPSDTPRILAIGRHVAKKGFITLLQACHLLVRRGIAFQCEIIGDEGDSSDSMRGFIAQHDLASRVTLRAAIAQAQLAQIYARATLFVLPCTVMANGDRDGIPNVLAEAMATGLPVVSTPISGIPELIEHGTNGLLVPPDNPLALADCLALLLDDSRLRSRLGDAARCTIVDRFDASATTRTLYDLLLGNAEACCP